VLNIAAQLKLVHFSNANDLNFEFRVEVTVVQRIVNKVEHLLFESVDVLKGRIKGDENGNLFPHGFTASDVLHPQVVQDNVGSLNNLAIGYALEDGVQQRNVLDGELIGADIDAVANVVRMFDEEVNAGTKDFLASRGEDKGQGKEGGG
jgi:hypothetical protein